jgi:glycosyltransferase involved in cell wall biosynthesis
MAMGLGLPCISTPYPFAREMFQDHSGGVLVPFRDSAAMSRGLEYLLDDEERAREIGQRGRAKTSNWKEVAKRYLELIYEPALLPLPLQSAGTSLSAHKEERGRLRSSASLNRGN